jgi:spore coat polysaccharide biosynthesis protein SpsF (cytidylyltransferase family)
MSFRTVAIIQARTGSSRLPSKVLAPLSGRPLIEHVLRRTARARRIDEVVLATTESPGDDPVARIAEAVGFRVVRGSEHDVLSRYAKAIEESAAEVVVRLTGDCPLLEPEVIDLAVETFESRGADYAYASTRCGFPRGLDSEVVLAKHLLTAHVKSTDPFEREHVTPYIDRRPDIFAHAKVEAPAELTRPHYRLCVDEPVDFELVDVLYRCLADGNGWLRVIDVIAFLDAHPRLAQLNAHAHQIIDAQTSGG